MAKGWSETLLRSQGYRKAWEDDEFSAWKAPVIEDDEFSGLYCLLHKGTGLFVMENYESLEELLENLDWASTYVASGRLAKEVEIPTVRLGEKKKFGRKVAGEEVLDIGAGSNPDWRATHAVDLRRSRESDWEDIEYEIGVDLDKDDLPYKEDKFDKIVSHGSLGKNFGTGKTYSEIRRVLKPRGNLEITFGFEDEDILDLFGEELRNAGFRDVRVETDKNTAFFRAMSPD